MDRQRDILLLILVHLRCIPEVLV